MLTPRLRAILIGGGIAGFCDISYACGFWALRGVAPARVLQSVASGLLGADAFNGGATTAALGLALHFLIALIFAGAFVLASGQVAVLGRRAFLSGAIYGFLIFWLMNLVVLPLSAFPRKVTFAPAATITGLIVHTFLIGVPIALAARRAVPVPSPR
ncbi:MAG: hypothetical protein KF715_03060 [Candidatus Didemnitutus sp.]|nr:hypothetical protein [Candidatus Didemnitutus sp.]